MSDPKTRARATMCYFGGCSRTATIVLLLVTAGLSGYADSFTQRTDQSTCTCEEIRQQILNAPSNPATETTILIPPGHYFCDSGFVISEKKRLRLRGSGRDNTVLHFAYEVENGILIGDNVDDLEISSLSLEGSMPLYPIPDEPCSCPEHFHRGIGTVTSSSNTYPCCPYPDPTYSTNISNIRIFDLEIFDFGTGIQIHPLCADTQGIPDTNGRNIEVRDNFIHDVGPFVYGGGWGYGIHSACIDGFVVKNNVVMRAARHAIYYGGGNHSIDDYQNQTSANRVIVENNLILNSGSPTPGNFGISNLPIARTSFVTVANNTIVNPQSIALSVESEDRAGKDPNHLHPQNVVVVGNRILHSSSTAIVRQIWLIIPTTGLPATDRVFLCGNTFNGSPTSLSVHQSVSTNMDGVDSPQNFYAATTPTSWVDVQAVTPASTGGLYMMQGNLLHHIESTWKTINPGSWGYMFSPTNWSGFEAMDVTCPYLFVLQNGVLHRLPQGDINSYELHRYSDGTLYNWSGSQVLYATKKNLYILQNSSIHRIPAINWEVVELLGDYPNGDFLTSFMEHVIADLSEDTFGDACCCVNTRGDFDGNGTEADVLDLTYLINDIFRGGPSTECPKESDLNLDGTSSNILDLTYLVNSIYRGGPAPGACI